jgi:SNARE associated Golgi protein
VISLSSALGSVAGKMIVFCASYNGHKMLNTRTKRSIFPLHRLLREYGWLGAFLAAAIPVPDDVVYITLGLAKYSPFRFATAAGIKANYGMGCSMYRKTICRILCVKLLSLFCCSDWFYCSDSCYSIIFFLKARLGKNNLKIFSMDPYR